MIFVYNLTVCLHVSVSIAMSSALQRGDGLYINTESEKIQLLEIRNMNMKWQPAHYIKFIQNSALAENNFACIKSS